MSETERIVSLSRRARARGEQLCLATVVQVEGSAYRKPGARMLVTSGGERAGTISGGCLEAEVSRRALWLTARGSRVERYSSFADEDGGMPYGLGCGGTISLLLEQGDAVEAVLTALERVLAYREPSVIAVALGGGSSGIACSCIALDGKEGASLVRQRVGTMAVWTAAFPARDTTDMPRQVPGESAPGVRTMFRRSVAAPGQRSEPGWMGLERAAEAAFRQRRSCLLTDECFPYAAQPYGTAEAADGPAYFIEYLAAPPALTIFGAGDDAQPLAELAHALGWRVTVVDGRSHLARRERFPQAAEVRVLDYADPALRGACGMARLPATFGVGGQAQGPSGAACERLVGEESAGIVTDEIAVVLTHSYEQDRALLAALLPRELRYLGILGPRHRTERLLEEVAPLTGLSVAEGFARLHSPIGLDLGAGDPAAVALSIIAEIQALLHGRDVAVTRMDLPRASGDREAEEATAIVASGG